MLCSYCATDRIRTPPSWTLCLFSSAWFRARPTHHHDLESRQDYWSFDLHKSKCQPSRAGLMRWSTIPCRAGCWPKFPSKFSQFQVGCRSFIGPGRSGGLLVSCARDHGLGEVSARVGAFTFCKPVSIGSHRHGRSFPTKLMQHMPTFFSRSAALICLVIFEVCQ